MKSDYLTAEQSAKRANVSRPTISRALKAAELFGMRDNRGRWSIKPEDLDRWAAERSGEQNAQRAEQSKSAENEQIEQLKTELSTAREDLARAQGENTANKERINDLKEDRERLLKMLDAKIVKTGFFARLFNRG